METPLLATEEHAIEGNELTDGELGDRVDRLPTALQDRGVGNRDAQRFTGSGESLH